MLNLSIVLGLLFAGSALAQSTHASSRSRRPPNIVIIFTDDQGYGDLGCYGSKTIRSPRIDQLAKEGTRFTSYYVQVVCGPSRSALLTGRYPVRSHGWSMPASEITIAERLKTVGYTTGCIGKWDVSNRAAIKDRMPNAQGFDYYWGTLGANDNGRVRFHHNNKPDGATSDMASLTRIYTDKGIAFMKANKDKPFLLYMAHTMVHSVIDASPEFKGKSKGGLYGDTIEELDYHTGRLLDTIDELGLRDNTIVMFLSDNGPWNNMQKILRRKHKGAVAWGSSGPLREGKGSTYEGGLRVPCIMRWPGKVKAGRASDAILASIDLMPTLATLAGYELPDDRILDGVDQTKLLLGESETGARDNYYYFCRNELHAVRKGKWKLRLPNLKVHYGYVKDKGSGELELYDLEADLGESKNLAEDKPEVVAELQKLAKAFVPPKVPLEKHTIRIRRPKKREAKK
ncbi:MAG: sulfatase family protein [Planctomycetota bacterium]|jgi:arylsulfatase A-like enzyme